MNGLLPRNSTERPWRSLTPAVLAIAGLASHGPAQTTWSLRASQAVPPARIDAGLAYDAARQRTVLFAGGNGVALFDTWEWDGFDWRLRIPVNSPPARESGRMVFHSASGVTVLFGGISPSSALNDTWEWNGTDWTQRIPATSPPARYYHAMAYDAARGETVLFGGYGGGHLGDTWVWNGTNWTQRFPARSPGPRTQLAMAYDAARQRVVAFGGRSSPTSYPGDTWEWDGTDWTPSSPLNAPGARESHAMTYDSLRERVVLFGGNNSSNQLLNDTWEWNGSNWIQRSPALAPAPVRYHAMAYDSARARAVLFGGYTPQPLNQTWEYYHPAPATYVLFDSGCPGSAGTPSLSAEPGSLPWIGDTLVVNLANARPLSWAALLWGFSNTSYNGVPLPLNLGYFGAPLCFLRVDPLVMTFTTAVSGNGSVSRDIPNIAELAGVHLYDQFAVYDPTANALGFVFTQGGDAHIAAK